MDIKNSLIKVALFVLVPVFVLMFVSGIGRDRAIAAFKSLMGSAKNKSDGLQKEIDDAKAQSKTEKELADAVSKKIADIKPDEDWHKRP